MERRTFLKSVGAASLSSPLIMRTAFAAESPLKIGSLIPLSGPASLFGPSCRASATLAMEEINAAGGIIGRNVEILFTDGDATPSRVANDTQRLWRGEGVEALTGTHNAAARDAALNAVKGQIPYVYTTVGDGAECRPGFYTLGETPAQQLDPSIPWLAENRGAKNWYLIGADYNWPRISNAHAKEVIAQTGGKVVGEEYLPFAEASNFDASLERIKSSGADAVFITLVGGAAVAFCRAFASFGLDKQALRFGTLMEELTLGGIGAESSKNLFMAAAFFNNLETEAAKNFKTAYADRFGNDAPALSTLGESCYDAIYLLRAMIEAAGSTDPAKIEAASDGVNFQGPRGNITLSGKYLSTDIYLAEAVEGTYEIVASFEDVAPGNSCA